MATELGEKILKYLAENGPVDTLKLATEFSEDHQKIIGAIKSIQSLGDIIEAEQVSSTNWELTEEGKLVAENGSHEALVFYAVPESGVAQAELLSKVPNAKVGFSKAMSAGWIAIDKSGSNGPLVRRKVQTISDTVREHLRSITTDLNAVTPQQKQDYKKRKLIQEVVVKSYLVKAGPSFSTSVSKQETDLTPEMLASGSWKSKQFKPYNLDALGASLNRGHLHPLLKVRAEFRQIFLEMGFTEMPTNNYVESSFWNFDALFQPQQHPARDAHDTFFISEPANANQLPTDYLERVKTVHSVGGYGSIGYGYDWKIEEARKNLLRTHTTAVSARMLHALAQNEFRPAKYFSIDRVFRNETLDATHLAEFHQIEGVIADYGLTLGDLIGVLYEFFRKLGIEKLRFKPAYNPYTEPSMEVFSYHPGLGKWVEIGNSGVFRPELLLPMGIPEDVTVLAWGLSLERPTMIKYGIDNIRDLVGPKVNLQMVFDNPVCRLDKHQKKGNESLEVLEQRLDSVISELEQLEKDIHQLKQKSIPGKKPIPVPESLQLILEADPSYPPAAVLSILKRLQDRNSVQLSVHTHSTLQDPLPEALRALQSSAGNSHKEPKLKITLIWKPVGSDLILKNARNFQSSEIFGEQSAARLLSRWIEAVHPGSNLVYESRTSELAAAIDQWIDTSTEAVSKSEISALVKRVEQRVKTSSWLLPGFPTLADLLVGSKIRNSGLKVPPAVEKWLNKTEEL